MSHKKKIISQEILLGLLKTGAILFVAVTAPNVLQILKPLFNKQKIWREYYPSAIFQTTKKLLRHGYVELIEEENGYRVKITDKARTILVKGDLENLQIATPNKWDGKWRMVVFDIPEKYKKQRNYLCRKLKELNFYPLQESVFLHPFNCEKEIIFLREVLQIPHYVKFGLLQSVENDSDLRQIFRQVLGFNSKMI